MTDAYRTAALTCPACASPMREFQKRLVCDGCEGLLIPVADFASACGDLIGRDAPVELHDVAPAGERAPVCPRCTGQLGTCAVTVAGKALRGRFSVCERDGLWFGRDVLPAAFATLTRSLIGYVGGYKHGDHTRRTFQARTGGDASEGLTIAAWRHRPRKRAPTLTPVNVYRDQRLGCPACPGEELRFLADRYGCDGCGGVFVETAALVALVEEMTAAPWEMPASIGTPGPRACPICEAALREEPLEGAAIDRCATHGVWFDPRELETVLQEAGSEPSGVVAWLRRLWS